MMSRIGRKLFWILIASGMVALVAYGLIPQPIEVDTVQPTTGSLAITIDDDGETRIRERYILSAPVTGKMLRVELDAGDLVVAGETKIAKIQPSDPSLLDARSRAEAQARVRVAIAAHDQATTAVARAKEALELAEKDFERAKKLRKNNAIAQADYDAADNRMRLAIADIRSAESAQRVAQYEIDQAEATVKYMKASYDPDDDHFFNIVSPITGKVLEIFREDSGVIASGTSVASIGDPSDLEIVIDVLSSDAVKVRLGNPVRIQHWGGEKPLDAVVRLVEPSAFLKVSALGVEEKRVNVIADFTDPFQDRETLGDGFRIEAKIVVDDTPADSMNVPAGVLFRQGKAWKAYRVINGTAEPVTVEVGKSNGISTEILSGVQPSDQLILHPTESIESGVKVIAQ
ncbi:efflux RND transporter periplasmic adaptor subunit [Planctomycetes bacterium K23_9]|uniref:Putative efflux pump membrane fusion protein n=1 Tax=Stieleria marina TaxID=1930275 RepID=A0A517NXA0_9BACT|nr:putative efflux pump membrane fusion protein [Planctomycetes bacterium K23_9]